jgi:hypothetical protein
MDLLSSSEVDLGKSSAFPAAFFAFDRFFRGFFGSSGFAGFAGFAGFDAFDLFFFFLLFVANGAEIHQNFMNMICIIHLTFSVRHRLNCGILAAQIA